jgi:hypothetical protein
VKQASSQRISVNLDKELKEMKEDKDMNVSELGFDDERESEVSINADQAIQQFAYHHVPKKSEGLLKHERALLGIKPHKEVKRNLQPLVIEIDEDELISNDSAVRKPSESKLQPNASNNKRRHLRIDSDDLAQVDAVEIQSVGGASEEEKNHWTRKEKG